MTKDGSIHISVNGGTAAFGNIVQGNYNDLSTEQLLEASTAFDTALAQLKNQQLATAQQVNALKADLNAALSQAENNGSLPQVFEELCKRYEWALKPLKILLQILLG